MMYFDTKDSVDSDNYKSKIANFQVTLFYLSNQICHVDCTIVF